MNGASIFIQEKVGIRSTLLTKKAIFAKPFRGILSIVK